MRALFVTRSLRRVAALLGALLGALLPLPAPLAGQTIGLQWGDSARMAVGPSSKVAVPLRVDFSAAAGANLAALQAGLTWNPARLTLDSIRGVPATGFSLAPNLSAAPTGASAFNLFNATGMTASGALVTAHFTAAAATGGTRLTLTPTAAGNEAGTSILSLLRVRNLEVCVAPQGKWGDANGDDVVNIIDAQQVARYSVGLSVANATALAARADVTADGAIDIIDAQQVARFSVGLSAAARTNMLLAILPTVAAIQLSPSAAQTVAQGSALAVAAVPRDAAGTDQSGCAPLTWTSSNPAIATVTSDGVITGVATGTATITVTSGTITQSLAVTVPSGPFPTSGLLAYLPMSGSTNDSSGLGNHFLNNGGTFVADRFNVPNSAVKFDGNSASASRAWPTFPKDFGTVAFWFRNADTPYTQSTYSYFLWGTAPGAVTGSTTQWMMNIDQNSGFCSYLGGTGDGYGLYWNYGLVNNRGTLVESNPSLAFCLNQSVVATWRHVAMVVANNEISIYENGQLRQKMAAPSWTAASTTAYLGVLNNTTAGNGAARYIDSFGVWNRPLTASEVDAIYRFR